MKKIVLPAVCMILMSSVALPATAMAQDTAAPASASSGQHQRGQGMTKAQFMQKAQERAEKRFAMIDTNGDGVITREEMRAARAKMKGRRGQEGGQQGGQQGGGEGGHDGGNQFP